MVKSTGKPGFNHHFEGFPRSIFPTFLEVLECEHFSVWWSAGSRSADFHEVSWQVLQHMWLQIPEKATIIQRICRLESRKWEFVTRSRMIFYWQDHHFFRVAEMIRITPTVDRKLLVALRSVTAWFRAELPSFFGGFVSQQPYLKRNTLHLIWCWLLLSALTLVPLAHCRALRCCSYGCEWPGAMPAMPCPSGMPRFQHGERTGFCVWRHGLVPK